MSERGERRPLRSEALPAPAAPVLALNHMGGYDWDLENGTLHMDSTGLDVFGLTASDVDQAPGVFRARLPPTEAERLETLIADAVKNGSESFGTYFRLLLPDGTPRWAYARGSIRRGHDGRAHRIIGILRDATDELSESGPRRRRQQRRRKRLAAIVQNTTTALGGAHTVQDVIRVLKETHGMEHLGVSSMVLGLVEGGRIRLVASSPESGCIPGTAVTRFDDPYPMSTVVRTLEPVYLETPEEFAARYPGLWSHVEPAGVTCGAYLPLVAQARPIGAVGLLYHGKVGFTDEDRNLMVALASTIGQSLQRAMFYDQAKDVAQSLQRAMLPHTIPAVPGAEVAVRYRSASLGREIGGDWYDVIRLPGGRYGAVIGDVQGHDTHAAAVMGQLRIVLRAYAAEGHTPATVMNRASAFLHELDTERFATCVYVEADLSDGLLQIVRAGHIDPLVRDEDGTSRRLAVEGGLPLGHAQEFGSSEYPVASVVLDPGQTLLLFTDGLVEQPGVDLDVGISTLAERVRTGPDDLQELADLLCDEVDGRGGEDDVAMLLMRRRGRGAAPPDVLVRQRVAPDEPRELSRVRRLIRTAAWTVGAGERGEEVELVVDELVTNVLVHTEGPAMVTLRLLPGPDRRLRIEVEDASSALPRRRESAYPGVSGRGLLLVDQLTDVWGVEPRGGGKAVWCEFRLPAAG